MSRILVTGAAGSIGEPLVDLLRRTHADVLATDIDTLDVLDEPRVRDLMYDYRPTLVYHMAAAKHAPDGERSPYETSNINIQGTYNVLANTDAPVVLASTCKACNPETAYGASKLIAERMVLNAGGWVGRLYNVIETQGNVFRTWEGLPHDEPLPVTACLRYFLRLPAVVRFFATLPSLEPGRYTLDPGYQRSMLDVARSEYPGRGVVAMIPRRGDRISEPRKATHEHLVRVGGGVERITSPHDIK